MIEFIKKAITEVEGVKTLLLNDDYRNNFNYGEIDYPCAVLTPIPSKTYSTKSLIRESYELHLAILDVVPHDYDGETLHLIQNNCSELGLQILSNLQVRTTMDKDVKFEFIMPSDDEFLCGAMVNLQVTAKQPRCAGQPTYIEVKVEAIKHQIITQNGKYQIRPSDNYTAMKGVDVEVNVEGAREPILQDKADVITENGKYEYYADEDYDGLSKVAVEVDVQPILEFKQITINNNGTRSVTPSSGFDGLAKVDVTVALPLETQKTASITSNGMHVITPTSGNIAMQAVQVDVDVPQKKQRVNYIRRVGQGYIDTGVDGANNNLKIKIRYSMRIFPTGYWSIVHAYKNEQTDATRILLSKNAGVLCSLNSVANSSLSISQTRYTDIVYTDIIEPSSSNVFRLKANGSSSTKMRTSGEPLNETIKIFGATTDVVDVELFGCEIYDGDELVRDFIPDCKNGEFGLYDIVTKQFFSNIGDGIFSGELINIEHL